MSEANAMAITDLFISTNGHAKARAEHWLEARIRRSQKGVFGEPGELSPDLAALLLERNPENRTIKPIVHSIARDISQNRYTCNGEPIIISRCGKLNDGQHRCQAVLMAGKPIKTMFVFGVSRESRTTVDQGTARTAGDYLHMEGVSQSNQVAAIARMLIEIEQFGKLTTSAELRPSKSEILTRAKTDPSILDAVHAARKQGGGRVASLSILGTAYYLFSQVDPDDADYFIDKLIKGTELSGKDPIFVAREKLIRPDNRLNQNEKLKTIIMAWNNYRASKTVRTLTHSIKKGQRLPEIR